MQSMPHSSTSGVELAVRGSSVRAVPRARSSARTSRAGALELAPALALWARALGAALCG